jgi:hypothetical protein
MNHKGAMPPAAHKGMHKSSKLNPLRLCGSIRFILVKLIQVLNSNICSLTYGIYLRVLPEYPSLYAL